MELEVTSKILGTRSSLVEVQTPAAQKGRSHLDKHQRLIKLQQPITKWHHQAALIAFGTEFPSLTALRILK